MKRAFETSFKRLGAFAVRRRGVIIVGWVLVALLLNLFVPQLERVMAQSASPMIPDKAPSMRALPEMDKRFGGEGAHSSVFVVLVNKQGISEADERYYGTLVDRLREQSQVASVQDENGQPALKDALTSADGKAKYIPVGLWGKNGSPRTTGQIEELRDLVHQDKPSGLQVSITGPTATVADMQTEIERSMLAITIVTVALIACILLFIYRSPVITIVALSTVGLSLATARAVTALLGLGAFEVSTFTASFLTAVVLGAGVDYSVFLISRFHESLRADEDSDTAVAGAVRRVAAVIIASATTVIAACSGMALAGVSFFYTTGPAIAVSLLVTLLAALTLNPAMLALAAKRGLGGPRSKAEPARRQAMARYVVRRPGTVLAAGLVILIAMAAVYPSIQESYDTRSVQPAATESNEGYDLLNEHFPRNELFPEYILVDAGHDMRNPRDLAALETAASDVAKLPGVEMVRGVTRPMGSPLSEASIGNQVGDVGEQLGDGEKALDGENGPGKLNEGSEELKNGTSRVADGTRQLAEGSDELAAGTKRAVDAANRLLDGMTATRDGIGRGEDGAGQADAAARRLADGAAMLASGLDVAHEQVSVAVDGLDTAASALRADPVCRLDPVCSEASKGVDQVLAAERDKLLPALKQAASAAHRIADGNEQLASGTTELRQGLAEARKATDQLVEGQRTLKQKLGEMSAGADELSRAARALAEGAARTSDGAVRLHDGTTVAVQSLEELRRGLSRAAEFLTELGDQAEDPNIGGFYLPARAMQEPRMALASGMFLSEDGKTARLMVIHSNDAFGRDAMRTADAAEETTREALGDTSLRDSGIMLNGIASSDSDLDTFTADDFRTFALFAVLAVLLILVVLLRSIVAPLHLLASVLLTYAAAMGVSVLVWQHVVGNDLSWSVAPVAFVILVAVGADYNLFLISRIREEGGDDPKQGTVAAMVATGNVITTAAVIFAASTFAMMAGSVTIIAQIGFTIGVGLLLDAFVVRTLLVPATVLLLGKWNWWPSRRA